MTTATVRRAPARSAESAPTTLRVIAPLPARSNAIGFFVVCLTLLVLSLGGLLVLNISLSRGAYHLHELQAQRARLTESEQARTEQLNDLAAPAQLCRAALALGMVPGGSPAFVRLPDGAVLGDPAPAGAPAVPVRCLNTEPRNPQRPVEQRRPRTAGDGAAPDSGQAAAADGASAAGASADGAAPVQAPAAVPTPAAAKPAPAKPSAGPKPGVQRQPSPRPPTP